MCLYFRRFFDGVVQVISASLCLTHPSEVAMMTIHMVNFLTRLAIVAMAITILMLIPPTAVPALPGIAMIPYQFSKWNNLSKYDWVEEELPQMQLIAAPGNVAIVVVWTVTIVSMFLNDILRCSTIIRSECTSRDNQIDMGWYNIACFSMPLIFAFTALFLGTRDGLTLLMVCFFTLISGMAAEAKECLRAVVNTETTAHLRTTVMWLLQTMHDLALLSATVITLLPFVYTSFHNRNEIATLDAVNAALFSLLYITLMVTQYSYEYRCSILELRWPSHRSVVMGQLAHHAVDQSLKTAHVSFPGPPDSYQVHPNQDKNVNEETLCDDPFNIEESEEIFDRIYGCHVYHESAAEHKKKQIELAPLGSATESFHTYMDNVGNKSRQRIGSLVEWRRYYAINMIINGLLCLGVLKMSGVVHNFQVGT